MILDGFISHTGCPEKQVGTERASPDGADIVEQRRAIVRHSFHHGTGNAYHGGAFDRRVLTTPPPWRKLFVKRSTVGEKLLRQIA